MNRTVVKIFARTWQLILLLHVTCQSINAQNQQFTQFSSANGLLSDKIYNLYADRQGFIWVFSEYGTLKYNGEQFIPTLRNLPLSEAFMYCMYERADGKKWAANSNANIYEIRNDSAIKINGLESIARLFKEIESEIIDIVCDEHDDLFLTSKSLSLRISKTNTGYLTEDLTKRIKNDSVRVLLLWKGNDLVMVHKRDNNDEFDNKYVSQRRYIYFDSEKKRVDLNYRVHTEGFRHFKFFNGSTYYTKADKLGRIDKDYIVHELSFGGPVINFYADANHHVWVGCLNDGLYEVDEKDSIVGHYLQGTTVNDVAVDFQNGVWASTAGNGLFRFANRLFEEIGISDINAPLSFVQAVDGGLVMGNTRGEVFFKSAGGTIKLRDAGGRPPISCLKRGNEIIVSFPYTIERYVIKENQLVKAELQGKYLKFNALYAMSGDTILGIWRRGLAFLSGKKIVQVIDFGQRIISSARSNDTIWFGTEKGLYFRSLKNNRVAPAKEFSQPVKETPELAFGGHDQATLPVTEIYIDANNDKWVAVMGKGIYQVKGSKWQAISAPPGEIVHNINTTNDPIIVCTNRGAYILAKKALNGQRTIRWSPIYIGEVQKAIVNKTELLLNTNNGLAKIKLFDSKEAERKVLFSFRELQFDTVVCQNQSNYSIPHRYKSIYVRFNRISFAQKPPDLNYRLSGPILSEGISQTSSIPFIGLVPGKYRLEVYPNINQGENYKEVVTFEIVPEWYETWWAYTLYVVLILIGVGLVVGIFIRRNKRAIQQKNDQEQLLLEYKLIALKAQINPHFISNCLMAIQNLISKGKTEAANQYVAKFGLLVRKILDYSGKSLITLKEELEVVTLYIQLEEVRFGKKFDLVIRFGPSVDQNDVMVPPLLLNPIVENAIWHGLLPLEEAVTPNITIATELSNYTLKITIADNGVGLQQKRTGKTERQSYGLELTSQRIKNINYQLNSTEGKVEINDRKEQDASATGVSVEILLPIKKRFDE